jgi:hypothetical protein
VIRSLCVLLLTAGGIVLWAGATFAANGDDTCEACRSRWMAAHEFLKQSIDACRGMKEASLAARIQQRLNGPDALSVAEGVQSALKERASALAEVTQKCRQAAAMENQAFDEWRKCSRLAGRKKAGPPDFWPDSVNAERKQIMARLQDLLMDDAYRQYKNYRPPEPVEYSGTTQQQQWGMGTSMGYQPNHGYGGYR